MCGIAGYVGEGSKELLEKMVQKLLHRGPDAGGLEFSGAQQQIAFGHRRLSIVDLSAPPQPMWDVEKKGLLCYNGEVYNSPELRQELENLGRRFATRTDTEVLLVALLEWGLEKTLARTNGMFAFSFYDVQKNKVWLARDRFGKKPLYYSFHAGGMVFASELSALLEHKATPRELDPLSVRRYFCFNAVPSPHTILKGVYKLDAGEFLEISAEGRLLNKKRWFQLNIEPDSKIKDPEATKEFGYLFDRAVKRRLMSDVPLGLFLSGGLDSSAVCESLFRQAVAVKTFSVGFEEKSFDESSYAKALSKKFGTEHHEKILSEKEVESELWSALESLDEPMGDSSIVPTYLLCRFARESVTVALGGDGGDELLAGYDPFVALPYTRQARALGLGALAPLLSWGASCLPTQHTNMSLEFKLRRWLRAFDEPSASWISAWMSSLSKKDFPEVFSGDSQETCSNLWLEEALRSYEQKEPKKLEEKSLSYFVQSYLNNSVLAKVDRASMKNSMEVRAPFLDAELLDFIQKLPYDLRFSKGVSKVILRQHLAGKVPTDILHRPKKGFGMPVAKWLVGPLRPYMETYLKAETIQKLGLNVEGVQKLWHRHLEKKEDQRAFLWNYLVLANWYERVLES